MTGSLFSPSWYRVAGLTPRIRSHAQIHRHQYRGQTWYVLQDLSSERFQRVSPAGYLIIGLMNGQRTVQEIWAVANTRLGDDAPTQDEMIQLLSKLHAADVLQCDVPPDTEELLQRYTSRTSAANGSNSCSASSPGGSRCSTRSASSGGSSLSCGPSSGGSACSCGSAWWVRPS